ncbi:response regulator transcription factor [Amycolatopsis rhizosphaerae]|uniref:Response regulator transcription factor n=1 Tax=Amycolatopsis rhizosphaerae TaxID=2053003 RepID=A0A558DNC4_9PSEU|nr:response regulator transcription factor [Amycolatopsis rhizosphaerae]TVT62498.1 response regulator transcription factor [Amycolatopsis rhizosphaerae]
METIRVTVCALDPITRAGLVNCLRPRADVVVDEYSDGEGVDVFVAAFDELGPAAIAELRAVTAESGKPVVLLMDGVEEADLLPAVDCRVVAILPRAAVTDDRLPREIRAAASGEAGLRASLLGRLLAHTERLQREVLAPADADENKLSPREIDVLRLMAEGMDTSDIARELRYSDRTVKNIIYTLTSRLRLRNRSHAVAYAMRAGLI